MIDPEHQHEPRLAAVVGIVPAAGQGQRLGPGDPKALRLLGGVPMLVHAVRSLASSRSVDLVVVAAPPHDVAQVRRLLDDHAVGAEVQVVAGGATRTDSVAAALRVLPPSAEIVLVHDAARALAPVELVDRVISAIRAGAEAVVPGLRVADTVKQVDADERVVATPDRATLRAIQTPQGFRRAVLASAHDQAAHGDGLLDVSDDAGLVERLGVDVQVIAGDPEAFKVTHPLDLVLAEAVLERRGRGASIR